MKKVLLFLVALAATLSMNAQTTEIYEDTTKVATYSGADVTVSFGEKSITVIQGTTVDLTYFGSDYKVVSKGLPPSTGTAKRKPNVDVKWVQLWKDGPKFAEYNIGATKATDCGYYLAWGGSFNQDATYNAGSAALSGSDDSAYNVWGPNWRMPTLAEINALDDNCSITWIDGQNNKYNNTTVAGALITGKGDYSSNSIFLPAAGNYVGGQVSSIGSFVRYWSSAPNSSAGGGKANQLSWSNGSYFVSACDRTYGCSVRPVYVEDIVAVTSVSLNKTELKVGVGNTETLSVATFAPENATNKKVLWTSSDESIATVDAYGKVTGVASGKCVITATTEDGGKTATCAVEVVVLTTGTAKATIGGKDVDVKWIQLWENGPKFAEYNVGVTDDKAESYGGYYCWGKATDKDSQGAYKDGTSALTGTDDTATNLWGSNWRMPTQTELQGLIDNCDVAWTTVGGKNGCKFTGKGAYSSNSVFLPAAGKCTRGALDTPGYEGNYYSSTPYASDSERAYYLNFLSSSQKVGYFKRLYGYSVRAVLAKE